jgi:hypothetical protein
MAISNVIQSGIQAPAVSVAKKRLWAGRILSFPLSFGILFWAGLVLRDNRVRTILIRMN